MARRRKTEIISQTDAISMFKLRTEGWSLQEIAEHYGVSVATAARLIKNATRETSIAHQDIYDARVLQMERLDTVIKIALQKFKEGEARYGTTLIKAIELQADLMGLRESVQVDRTAELVWRKLAKELGVFAPYAIDPTNDPNILDTTYEALTPPESERLTNDDITQATEHYQEEEPTMEDIKNILAGNNL